MVDGIHVHLVDVDDQLLDAENSGQEGVLLGLKVNAVVGGDAQNCSFGLAGTGDHVLHEVTVTGCVDDGEVVAGSEELLVSDVDRDATLALLLQSIHDVGEAESGLATLLCFLLELLDHVRLDVTCVKQ